MIWFTMLNVLKKVCNDNYVNETPRCISERVLDHSGRDKNSHILKHQIKKEHPCPQYQNFKVISSGFCNNTKKRRENYQQHCGLTLLDLP